MKAKSTFIFILMVAACGGPGAPLLRRSTGDGEGPLVPKCKNVSSTARVDDYITGSYLSTWGSASVEGTMEGVNDAMNGFGLDGQQSEFNQLPVSADPYCRIYTASAQEVSRIIADILPLLGNGILTSDEENGLFITDFIERGHRMARWKDSYEINVSREGPQRTVVRIFRKLYISRGRGVFNEAVSVGHNEAWIITKIAERLKE